MRDLIKQKIIYNHTHITYAIIQPECVDNVLINYLSPKEIKSLKIAHKCFGSPFIFIYMINTEPQYRNKKMGTNSLLYIKELLSDYSYPTILICENNYKEFDLVTWYIKNEFIDLYSNIEATLLISNSMTDQSTYSY